MIPIAPNLAEWLRPYAGLTGPIWPKGARTYHVAINELRTEIELARWPNNGLRHSFASYYLAKHEDGPALMLHMGHVSMKLIFANYRELVMPEEAERYWNIKPEHGPVKR